MAAPQVPIEVDAETGVWTTDGLPMLYVPRHFLVNNHLAVEEALGVERYARQLYDAGYKSAHYWCRQEAATHGLAGVDVFHHYMRRLSQRGWGRFTPLEVSPEAGTARVRLEHSCFVLQLGRGAGRKLCYMFAGWFPGALAWVGESLGLSPELIAEEVQCAGEGRHDHCLFEVRPRQGSRQANE